jgi:hypothetical protein
MEIMTNPISPRFEKNRWVFALMSGITGLWFITGGIIAILYYLEDVRNPENGGYVIPGAILIFGLGLIFCYGAICRWKRPLPGIRWKKTSIIGWTLLFFLALSIGGPYILFTEIFVPRELYPRSEQVVNDPNFQFETQFGDLNQTVYAITAWNLSDPTDPNQYAWGYAYYLRYQLNYINATYTTNAGNNSYLFWNCIRQLEIILNHSDWNADGVPGFGTAVYTDGIYVEYPVWDGMIFLPMVRAVRLIYDRPEWEILYGSNASRFLAATERMIQKWDRTNWVEGDGPFGRYGYYVDEPRSRFPNNEGIYNRFAALGRVCLDLYQITGNQTYLDRAIMMGRYFKMGLALETYRFDGSKRGMYVWPYMTFVPQSPLRPYFSPEDTSHGSIEMDFAADLYAIGEVFDGQDMERFGVLGSLGYMLEVEQNVV